MSQGPHRLELQVHSLVARIELLELENRELSRRVRVLEENSFELVAEPASGARADPASPAPRSSSSTSVSTTTAAAAPGSDAFRGQVADEIGAFLRRCLRGEHRGQSGREKVDLPNRLYVICRDLSGRTYNPVKVLTSWREARDLIAAEVELGIGARRKVFMGCIRVPRAHTVALAAPENRAEAVEGLTARLWVAQLAPEWSLFVDIVAVGETEVDLAVNFGEGLAPEHLDCFPLASDLLVAARERLSYHTAEEFGPEGEEVGVAPTPWEARVLTLEQGVASLQEGLQEVLRQLREPQPKAPAATAAIRPPALKQPGRARDDRVLTFLDPAVLQAARRDGVPEAHIREMAEMVGKNKTRVADPAPSSRPPERRTSLAKILDQTDDEDEAEDEAPIVSNDPMALAIAKLTVIAENLVAGKKKASTFQGMLEGGHPDASGSVASGRRNAAALRVLRRALQDHPKELTDGILERMAADFGLAKGVPGGGQGASWLETRARMQHQYPTTIRFAWILAGIVDALCRGAGSTTTWRGGDASELENPELSSNRSTPRRRAKALAAKTEGA